MAISGNIFKSGKSNSTSGNDDVVGRFRSGFQDDSGNPVGLSAWRATTSDNVVAESLAAVLKAGEEVSEWETKSGEIYQVFGSMDTVDIVLDSPSSVRATLVLWSNKGGKIMESDGEYLIEEGKLTDRPDPDAGLPLKERKEKARQGIGPGPSLQAYFRLADAPDLGKFKFFSAAWTAIENFSDAELDLGAHDGPCRATLRLEVVEWEDKKTGQLNSFTRPEIVVVGPVEEAF